MYLIKHLRRLYELIKRKGSEQCLVLRKCSRVPLCISREILHSNQTGPLPVPLPNSELLFNRVYKGTDKILLFLLLSLLLFPLLSKIATIY